MAYALTACTPYQGMGCYPCCGVTGSTTGLQQSGNAGLGAAVLLGIGALVWAVIKSKTGGKR
jgi:hypothetical protein